MFCFELGLLASISQSDVALEKNLIKWYRGFKIYKSSVVNIKAECAVNCIDRRVLMIIQENGFCNETESDLVSEICCPVTCSQKYCTVSFRTTNTLVEIYLTLVFWMKYLKIINTY